MSEQSLIITTAKVYNPEEDQNNDNGNIISIPLYNNLRSQMDDLIEVIVSADLIHNDSPTNLDKESLSPKNILKNIPVSLGYIAEALVVRECQNNSDKNMIWAKIAKYRGSKEREQSPFYWFSNRDLNNYTPIATGLNKSSNIHYNPHSLRDIIWIRKDNLDEELFEARGFGGFRGVSSNLEVRRSKRAGIQLKVSCQNYGRYVYQYFKRVMWTNLYPVVYFDLGGDFDRVRAKLLRDNIDKYPRNATYLRIKSSNKRDEKKTMFPTEKDKEKFIDDILIRGKDIDPKIHEQLEFYKEILEKLSYESGEINLSKLLDKEIRDSLLLEYVYQKTNQKFNGCTLTSTHPIKIRGTYYKQLELPLFDSNNDLHS